MLVQAPLWICLTTFLLFACCFNNCSSSTINIGGNGGYQGIVIAISPKIQEAEGKHIITKVTELFRKMSELLHTATTQHGHPLFIDKFTFLVSEKWTTSSPGGLRYQRADVRIIKDDSQSYIRTKQMGGCGEPGEFIEISTGFISAEKEVNPDTRKQAQLLLQNWARYRYGVFPEESDNSNLHPKHYRSPSGISVTGCTTPNPWIRTCSDEYNEQCTFEQNFSVKLESSLMDSATLEAKFFCDKSTHNSDAPTIHNGLCGRKSVWEIVSKHKDFQGASANPNQPPASAYETIKAQQLPIVLVVDSRLCQRPGGGDLGASETVRLAIGSALKNIFPIAPVRIIISSAIPSRINVVAGKDAAVQPWRSACSMSASSNPADLDRAIEEGSQFPNDKGVLIVLANTDAAPQVKSRLQTVAVVTRDKPNLASYFISYPGAEITQKEDFEFLQRLSPKAKWYNFKLSQEGACDLKAWKEIHDALRDIVGENTMDFHPASVTRFTKILPISSKDTFFIGDTSSKVKIVGHYCPSPPKLEVDGTSVNTAQHSLSQTVENNYKPMEAGMHTVAVLNNKAYVSVVEYPTTTSAISISVNVEQSMDVKAPVTIRASIHENEVSITGAEVIATLISKDGRKSFPLLDTGSGDPDTFLNDGIYSRYIIPQESGIYEVVVSMAKRSSSTALKQETGAYYADLAGLPLEAFRSVGSFYFSGKTGNVYPPSQILDFRLNSQNHDTRTVQFAWTAPGENYDLGKADKYEVKCSICSDTVADEDRFARLDFQSAGLRPPSTADAGSTQTLNWIIPQDSSNNGKLLYCAIRTEAKGVKSLPSNVVAVQINTRKTTTPSNFTDANSTAVTSQETPNETLETLQVIRHAIIGGTVTIIALLLLIIGLLVFFKLRKTLCHHRKKDDKEDNFSLSRQPETSRTLPAQDNPAYTPEPRVTENPKGRFKPPSKTSTAMFPTRALPNVPPSEEPGKNLVQTRITSEVPAQQSRTTMPFPSRGQNNSACPSSSTSIHQTVDPDEMYMNTTARPTNHEPSDLQLNYGNEEDIYDDIKY